MRFPIKFVASTVAMAALLTASWLVINGLPANAQAPPAKEESSVRITVDGDDTRSNVAEGDVVDNGEKTEGVDCAIPDVTIEMAGDVKKVVLAVNNNNCNTYVKKIQAEEGPVKEVYPQGVNFHRH
ncbi:MAG: hypothetical protein OXC18_07625 [Desulfurellaceae bacterium]|nr:hypothetical protein [Desulfurellaceae bacterium]